MNMKPIRPFEPTSTDVIPTGNNWIFEPLSRVFYKKV